MQKVIISFILILMLTPSHGQVTEGEKTLREQSRDTLTGWNTGGVVNLNTSQTSLTNWAAGGQSSFALGSIVSLYANDKGERSLWENYLNIAYGTIKQGKEDWKKTDDKLEFTSKYGYRAAGKLYYAGLLNFKTQLSDGYSYPDKSKISSFLAPGYLLAAAGIDYKPAESLSFYFAPATWKLTIVNDQELADAGAFGVTPGEKTKNEFGGYLRMFLNKALMENIVFQTKLDLFSNYLKNPQNIDVSWETLLSLKVNTYISATLSTNLLYDDDINIWVDDNDNETIDAGEQHPRTQFKEVLAVGFSYTF
jgi:hypothetical protein